MGRRFTSVLAVEGEATGDGRFIAPGAVTWANCPLPLDWVPLATEGHDGAMTIGVLETISRLGSQIVGTGRLLDSAPYDLEELIGEGVVGPSIDPDDVVYEVDEANQLSVMTAGRIRGATLVNHPAIVNVSITFAAEPDIDDPSAIARDGSMALETGIDSPDSTDLVEPSQPPVAPVAAPNAGHTSAMLALIPSPVYAAQMAVPGGDAQHELHLTLAHLGDAADLNESDRAAILAKARTLSSRGPTSGEVWGHALFNPAGEEPAATYMVKGDDVYAMRKAAMGAMADCMDAVPTQHEPFQPHVTAGYSLNPTLLTHTGPVTFDRLRVAFADEVYDMTLGPQADSITAAGGPPAAPFAWFLDPKLKGPTPLTITEDGQVFGHLATWGTCHTGGAESAGGVCTTAPRSNASYDYFHTGVAVTDDGTEVPTGRITVGGGHAGPGLGFRAALAHYDDAGAAAADVRAGEDRFGIWLAGSLRPQLDPSVLHALRGNPPSGDWRRMKGNLELMGALCVNTPGFPVLRTRYASSGNKQVSLVAAGMVHEGAAPDADQLVASVLSALDNRDRVAALAAGLGRDRASRVAALAFDVRS